MIFNKNNNGQSEIAPLATWTAMHEYWHIVQALELAKRKIIKIIGLPTYAQAEAHYWSTNYQYVQMPGDPDHTPEQLQEYQNLDQLVHHMQVILVNFAYAKNINKDTVIWDNTGIGVRWSDTQRPAQPEMLDKLQTDLNKHAYEFLDVLIEFLNQNTTLFSPYAQSVENLKLQETFINSAAEYSYYYNTNESPSKFFEALHIIRQNQRDKIYGALQAQIYYRVVDYQRKRLELEAVTQTVQTADQLPVSADPGTIILVETEKIYYKFTTVWDVYAYDVRDLLTYIKPALVYFTVYTQALSEINETETQAKIQQQKEFSAYYKSLAESELAALVKHIEQQTQSFTDPVTQTDTFISPLVTRNTFSI